MKKQVSICTNPKDCPYGDSPNVSDDESFLSDEASPSNPGRSVPSEILGEATNKRIRMTSPASHQARNDVEVVKDDEKGMKKWKYPKSPSFIVDMNNDPYQSAEKGKGKGGKKRKSETQRLNEDTIANKRATGTVYYPANSPMNHLPKKVPRKHKGSKFMRTIVIATAIVFIAVILYAIIADVMMNIRSDVEHIKELVEKLQNSSCNGTLENEQ